MANKGNLLSKLMRAYAAVYELITLGVFAWVLLILDLLHLIESTSIMIDLVLATLILLAVAMFRQRQLLEGLPPVVKEMTAFLEVKLNNILLDKYPAEYEKDLGRAKELWITGNNLRRITPEHDKRLREVLRNKGTIYVILLGEGDAVKYGAQQDKGPDADPGRFLHSIKEAYNFFDRLRKSHPERVHIRTIDYPLPFGIDAIDINLPNGVIYVRMYPFYSDRDEPILVLRPYQEKWYDFYKEQLKIQWDDYATDIDV